MKPCNQWREELADHVLGAPAGAGLAAHLKKCPACTSTLQEWQARMRKIDDGVRRLVASEPSAGAVARAIVEARSRSQGRIWVPQWKTAAATLGALLVLAASVAVSWRMREQRQETEQVLSAAASIGNWKSPTQELLRSRYDSWRKSQPRLVEYFYDLNSDSLKEERPAPRRKEK